MEAPSPKRRSRIKQVLFGSRKKDKEVGGTASSPPSDSRNATITATSSLSQLPQFSSPTRWKNGLSSTPPRPPNAWILYRRDKMRVLNSNAANVAQQRHHSTQAPAANDRSASSTAATAAPAGNLQAQVSRIVADMWKNETPFMRAEYARLAQSYKEVHREQFPDYRYSPRRKPKTNVEEEGMDEDDEVDESVIEGQFDETTLRSARDSSPAASKLSRKKPTAYVSGGMLTPDTLTPGKRPRSVARAKSTVGAKIKEEHPSSQRAVAATPLAPPLQRAVSADFLHSVDASRLMPKQVQPKRTRSSTRAPVVSRADIVSSSKRPIRKTQRGAAKAEADGDSTKGDATMEAWTLFGVASDHKHDGDDDDDDDEHVEELNEWRVDAQPPASARSFDGNTLFAPTWRATPPSDGYASQQQLQQHQQQQQYFHASFEGPTAKSSSSPTDASMLLPAFDGAAGGLTAGDAAAISGVQQAGDGGAAYAAAFSQSDAGAAGVGSGGDFASYYRRPSSFAGSVTSLASAPPLYNLAWDSVSMRGGAPRHMGVYAPSAASSTGSLLSLHSAPAMMMPRSFEESGNDYAAYLATFASSRNRLSPADSTAISENYVAPSPSDTSSCAASLTNAFAAWPPPSSGAMISTTSTVSVAAERYGSWSDAGVAMPSPSEQMASAGFMRANQDAPPSDISPFVPAQTQQSWPMTDALMSDASFATAPSSSQLWLSAPQNRGASTQQPQHQHQHQHQQASYAEQMYVQQVFGTSSFATLAPHSAPASYTHVFPRFDGLQDRQDEDAAILRDMQIEQYINGSGHEGSSEVR